MSRKVTRKSTRHLARRRCVGSVALSLSLIVGFLTPLPCRAWGALIFASDFTTSAWLRIPRRRHGPRAIDEVEEPIRPKKLQKSSARPTVTNEFQRQPRRRRAGVSCKDGFSQKRFRSDRQRERIFVRIAAVIATPVPRFPGCTKVCEFSANSSRENLVCLCQDGHRVITPK